ncbi:glycosyltransferase family 4 protein [Candidatus Uhrbacteria bacterium]|nr:glycosyltransferase family 4 protein [Candidatus Uhrbacteria bacterium]
MTSPVIVFSTAYLPHVGGAEIAVREITSRIPDREFHLFCAKLDPKLPSLERIGSVTVHRVGFGSSFDKYLLPILGPLSALRLTVHGTSRPLVWSIMASYGGFAALVYCWLRPRTRLLLTLQEGDPLEHYARRTGRLAFLHKEIFKRADAVQTISRFLADWAMRMGFRGTPAVVPNGVDIERFTKTMSPERREELRASFGFGMGDTVLITVSRLSLKNGIDDLIRSLTFLSSSAKLLCIGEGEDRVKLETLVRQKGLEPRVVFTGTKAYEELPDLLNAADVFVRPSLSEGLGNAFLEAMAAGVPIIGTSVGGIPDFLRDGETGLFCRVRDPESVATAVKRLKADPNLRSRLTENARVLVRQSYDWNPITRKMEELFASLSV